MAGSPLCAPAVIWQHSRHQEAVLVVLRTSMRAAHYVQDSWAKSSCGLERPNPANGSFDHLESGLPSSFKNHCIWSVCNFDLFLKMFENHSCHKLIRYKSIHQLYYLGWKKIITLRVEVLAFGDLFGKVFWKACNWKIIFFKLHYFLLLSLQYISQNKEPSKVILLGIFKFLIWAIFKK